LTEPRLVELPPTVRVGIEEAARGEGVTLTIEELERWEESGELPERIEQWAASLD
jgi:hypothetical protein